MGTLNVDYPESFTAVLNQSRKDFEQDAKMAMATKLFELGKLTSGQAATLAGISRVDFLLACPHFGVPSVYWDNDEIDAEFEGLL